MVLQSEDERTENRNIVHCDRCGTRMRIGRCRKEMSAQVIVTAKSPSGDQVLNLLVFEDVLRTVLRLRNIWLLKQGEIAERLLALGDLKIRYNPATMYVTQFM